MLTATFLHAPGVGPATEHSLWAQGATHWQHVLDDADGLKLPPRHRQTLANVLPESLLALQEGRVDYFARALKRGEHWRATSHFPRLGFLDIETDGGMGSDSVTVIGLGDGHDVRLYVKGRDLPQFADDCRDFDGFVTFFGTGFDLPMLVRRFPSLASVFAERLHVDLCPLLKRLGYRGGLKRIEHQLGIARVPEADGLSGMDAVRLWRVYRGGGRGSDDALRLLLAYNREDVANMKTLLDFALPRLQTHAGYTDSDFTPQGELLHGTR